MEAVPWGGAWVTRDNPIVSEMETKTPLHSLQNRRVSVLAISVGILSVLASLTIGWAGYSASIDATEKRFHRLYFAKARIAVGNEKDNLGLSDEVLLGRIAAEWRNAGIRSKDEYLCIVDGRSRLRLHTAHPQTVGKDVGGNRLLGGTTHRARRLKDLVESRDNYLGDYVSSAGEAQVAAFHQVPGRDWSVGVHRSKKALREEAGAGIRSLAIGFLLVCGFLLPMALLGLFLIASTALRSNRKTQESLRRREEEFRAIAEDLPALLCRFLPGGEIMYANEAYCAYFGKRREELVGTSFLSLIPAESRATVLHEIESLSVADSTRVHEHEVLAPAGEKRWQRWTNRALFDQDGKPIGYQAIGEDITDERHLREQLSQALRMEAIGRLAGGVAHDLNNLLTPVLGCAELLGEDLPAVGEQGELVADISAAGLRARDVVRQLLAFSRKQALAYRVLDLNKVINSLESMFRHSVRDDVGFSLGLAEGLPPVRADSRQLEQMLLNLAINAGHAMPDGGQLRIETSLHVAPPSSGATADEVPPGDYVLLTMTDSGVGMDSETRAHIFEPFFTTKEVGEGTGLGLATVFGIVAQHDGHIACNSAVGEGTTFRIYLPVSSESLDHANGKANSLPRVTRGDGCIVLVEDDSSVRRLAQRVLERKGYTVFVAEDGLAGQSLLEEHANTVDLLLTDVVMPGMNGDQLFAKASKRHPDLRVLFMSGYMDEVVTNQTVDSAQVHFLKKPFSAAELMAKVVVAMAQ
jgi:two-component system, cell cycle sensor histidine kinase and response regulator CckA